MTVEISDSFLRVLLNFAGDWGHSYTVGTWNKVDDAMQPGSLSVQTEHNYAIGSLICLKLITRTKKQHYVTRAYLEGFLQPREDQLFCMMRRRAPFRARPDEIAFEKNYYSFKRSDGTWNDSAETFFATSIEDPGLPVLKRLAEPDLNQSE